MCSLLALRRFRSYDPVTSKYLLSVLVITKSVGVLNAGNCSAHPALDSRTPPSLKLTQRGASSDLTGELLLTWRDWQGWRFILEVDAAGEAQAVQYQVSLGAECLVLGMRKLDRGFG